LITWDQDGSIRWWRLVLDSLKTAHYRIKE
jgi:hypothetical protein